MRTAGTSPACGLHLFGGLNAGGPALKLNAHIAGRAIKGEANIAGSIFLIHRVGDFIPLLDDGIEPMFIIQPLAHLAGRFEAIKER